MGRTGRLLVALVPFVLISILVAPSSANPGDLDPSFSGDGKATTSFGVGDAEAFGLAIQVDGKIVAAGIADRDGTNPRFALARYNVDGSLDPSFSRDGRLVTNFTRGLDSGNDVALLPNGKIVVGGGASDLQFAVARYRSDGTLDATFAGDGKVTTNFMTGRDLARAITVQSDRKIVAAGRAAGSGGRFGLVRYNRNGTLDTTFGGDGKVGTNFTRGNDQAAGLAVQIDGKIVAVGRAATAGGAFALARSNSDGTLDASFGGTGKVVTNFTPPGEFTGFDFARDVVIQPDGRIVAVGVAEGDTLADFALARYKVDGSLDPTFGNGGKVMTDIGADDNYLNGVALQADGKIVAAGFADRLFAAVRYQANGSLDPTFGNGGVVLIDFPVEGLPVANDVAIESNGKIVIAGTTAQAEEDVRFALARILAT
jgi:uncharacterized delta-60 repeat protein